MRSAIVVMLVVLAAALPVCSPAAPDIASEVAKLEQAYRQLGDMQAVFRQQSISGAVAVARQASGQVYFKKQGKMLWKYETPEEQHIILDGTTLWVYLPEEKQAMKNNFSIIPEHIVLDLFRGKIDILKKFKAAFAERGPGDAHDAVLVELVPLEPDPTMTGIILGLDPASYLVRRSVLTDAFGNRTELEFRDIMVDRGLPDSLFEFTPPKGVDVFEPPQM